MPNIHHPRRTTPANFIIIAVFLGGIWLPLADNAFHLDPSPPLIENRVLAPLPEPSLDWAFIDEFPKNFENFYDDHFGFRFSLVRFYNLARLKFLGNFLNAPVILGRDGWLFVNAGEGLLDDYRASNPMNVDELLRFQIGFEERDLWLRKRGIPYYLVFAANKSTIYPEYIPSSIHRARPMSRLDQLLEHLKTQTNIQLIDLRGPLTQAKSLGRLYHKTDTHWNELGAYVAYREIQDAVSTQFPLAAPKPLSEFQQIAERTTGRDLARMMALQDLLHEDYNWLVPKFKLLSHESSDNVIPSDPRKSFDELPFAMEVGDSRLPSAVMFRDSFAKPLVPFMSEHYRRIVFYWQMRIAPDVIRHEMPELVIQEIAERVAVHSIPTNPAEFNDPSLTPIRDYLSGVNDFEDAVIENADAVTAKRSPMAGLSYPRLDGRAIRQKRGRDMYASGWVATNELPKISLRLNGEPLSARFDERSDVLENHPEFRYSLGWILRIPGGELVENGQLNCDVNGVEGFSVPVLVQ